MGWVEDSGLRACLRWLALVVHMKIREHFPNSLIKVERRCGSRAMVGGKTLG
jgi:hypothetical protein